MISERQARMRIAQWCLEAMDGHPTAAVAGALGVRWNTAQDWKTGAAAPGSVMLLRLSSFTGYPLGEIDP